MAMTRTMSDPRSPAFAPRRYRRASVRWSAIFFGAVLAVGLQFLAMALWNALAYSSDLASFADNLAWWQAATSVATLFVGGLLAGWLADRVTILGGMMHGLAVWGLLVAGSTVFDVRSAFPMTDLANAGSQVVSTQPGSLWPTFVAFGLGAVAAAFGGFVGGLMEPAGTLVDDEDDLVGLPYADRDRTIDLRDPYERDDRDDLPMRERASDPLLDPAVDPRLDPATDPRRMDPHVTSGRTDARGAR